MEKTKPPVDHSRPTRDKVWRKSPSRAREWPENEPPFPQKRWVYGEVALGACPLKPEDFIVHPFSDAQPNRT